MEKLYLYGHNGKHSVEVNSILVQSMKKNNWNSDLGILEFSEFNIFIVGVMWEAARCVFVCAYIWDTVFVISARTSVYTQ